MSYSCLISFKKMEPIEIIPFLVAFKKSCAEHLRDIANEEYGYCPFIRDNLVVPDNFSDITIEERKIAQSWTHELFKFKYFYNTELSLLGVFGVPDALTNMFDKTIHFQDSTDQDYERSFWEGVSEFEAIYVKWMTMSWSDFNKEYEKRRGESFDDFIDKEHPEYGCNEMLIGKKMEYYNSLYESLMEKKNG